MGPHPYPWMVREFQRVIGDEARGQCRNILGGADPDFVVACAGGGSNAAGIFAGFADDTDSALVAVEAAGGAAMTTGIPGVLHGMRSALVQSESGQILEAHSISAGLDYPGIGPEHAYLGALGRARYETADDEAVLAAFQRLARSEGIIPALESAHAIAWVLGNAGTRRSRAVRRCWSTCRGGATRTWPRCGRSGSTRTGVERAGRPPRRPGDRRAGEPGRLESLLVARRVPGTSC